MFDREQLGWVLRNKQRPERAQPIGLAARSLVDRTRNMACRLDERVRRLVLAMCDDEFRAHCVLGCVERGVLMIAVDDVRWVYAFRLKWECALVQRIGMECPGCGVRAVRFMQSSDGDIQRETERARQREHQARERATRPRTRN